MRRIVPVLIITFAAAAFMMSCSDKDGNGNGGTNSGTNTGLTGDKACLIDAFCW